MQYLDVVSIILTSCVCKRWNSLVLSTDADIGLWRRLCRERGFENTGATRTRGHRSWRQIYLSNVCINCYEGAPSRRGVVVIDVAGGSSLKRAYQQHMPVGAFGSRLALCVSCLHEVTSVASFAERQKCCLQRLRRRRQGSYSLAWNELLNKIPAEKSNVEAREGGQGAHGNDFLLRQIGGGGGSIGSGKRKRKRQAQQELEGQQEQAGI